MRTFQGILHEYKRSWLVDIHVQNLQRAKSFYEGLIAMANRYGGQI